MIAQAFLTARVEDRDGRGAAPILLGLVGMLAGGGLLAIVVDALNDAAVLLHWALGGVLIAIVGISGLSVWWSWRKGRASAGGAAPSILELIREKDAAEAASAAKSRFLASVSHEIRSPLNSIYGYAQLLERGGERDPLEAARVIRRSAEHLTHLVDGLLDISLVENGVMKLSRDVIALAPFLDQIASMFRHGAAARGLTLRYDRPEILPDFVRIDQGRLRQVLINLLSNAIKFTPAGTVGFRVTYAGHMATFEISDTGPGIAPEHRDTIFAPFNRGAKDAPGQPGGVGLGLAITQALVSILGGALRMESTLGVGTTFSVKMMLGHVPGQICRPVPAALIGGYEGPRRSILVVDDDAHQLSLMRALLESLGFDVAVASRGAIAVEIERESQFDLAILDVSMPGLDGWETAERLRAGAGGPRIVMLSGNTLERHRADAAEPLHDMFLLKPVDLKTLIDAIGDLLDLRWTSPATAPVEDLRGRDREPSETLPEAARVHMRRMLDLLRIGHARGIESEIKALERAAPQARELTARLYGLLDRFDFPGLGVAIERHL